MYIALPEVLELAILPFMVTEEGFLIFPIVILLGPVLVMPYSTMSPEPFMVTAPDAVSEAPEVIIKLPAPLLSLSARIVRAPEEVMAPVPLRVILPAAFMSIAAVLEAPVAASIVISPSVDLIVKVPVVPPVILDVMVEKLKELACWYVSAPEAAIVAEPVPQLISPAPFTS